MKTNLNISKKITLIATVVALSALLVGCGTSADQYSSAPTTPISVK
ncbi:MAG: hypothetical protein HOO12_02340 [Methylococcales bacterium]|nr:hypothetical protein [Methylococcales bacterium]MBT4765574.1 hypothetical protein [Methylococcales bacterium]